MAGGAERIFAAGATVGPASLTANGGSAVLEVMAATWLHDSQVLHHGAPFRAMWFRTASMCQPNNQVRDFVRHGFGEECLRLQGRYFEVVADLQPTVAIAAHLPGRAATQITTDVDRGQAVSLSG